MFLNAHIFVTAMGSEPRALAAVLRSPCVFSALSVRVKARVPRPRVHTFKCLGWHLALHQCNLFIQAVPQWMMKEKSISDSWTVLYIYLSCYDLLFVILCFVFIASFYWVAASHNCLAYDLWSVRFVFWELLLARNWITVPFFCLLLLFLLLLV